MAFSNSSLSAMRSTQKGYPLALYLDHADADDGKLTGRLDAFRHNDIHAGRE